MKNKLIEVRNLSFKYTNDIVLKDINLDINQNDFLAIIGPNGGGKSTLLKLLLEIYPLQIGIINKFTCKIGYVPQDTNINTNFPIRVVDVVLMGDKTNKKSLFGYSKIQIRRANDALMKVGMHKYANNKIGALSGGQRQRVMIARALCTPLDILLLDEPTSSIDIQGQQQIYDLLKVLNKSMAIVVVSHDISVVLKYATKVAHIHKELNYHNIHNNGLSINSDDHFCEIELLEMLTKSKNNKVCKC